MESSRCAHCARRQRLVLACTMCQGDFCTRCLQLEAHACPKLAAKKQLEREKLAQKNPVIITSKLEKI